MTEYERVATAGGDWLERRTRETTVRVCLRRGSAPVRPRAAIRSGVPFLDHMLETLARYAMFDLRVVASGDQRHHLVEDVAIVMGSALRAMLDDARARYGERTVPMDDALVQVAIDLGGRAYYEGPLPSSLYDHWMRSFADHARATLHVRVARGRDRHHVVEAAFKALGLALREAMVPIGGVLSTKGMVEHSLVSVGAP
jgi:imidazoleglycerol-phosphate dehydratase